MKKEKDYGWISLYRKIQYHWIYPKMQDRKFSEYEAWTDLLMSASHKKHQYYNFDNNILVTVPRGCFVITVKSLSNRWKWTTRKTSGFLKILERDNMIKLNKINPKSRKSCTLLEVSNYSRYQDKNTRGCISNDTLSDTLDNNLDSNLTDMHNNNDNNDNNVNKREEYKKLYGTDDPYVLALKGIYPDD